MKKLNSDFRHATGAAILEWDSAAISQLKLLNEIAFEKYQAGDWSAHDLFMHKDNENHLPLAKIGTNLSGEYFSKISFGRNVTIGDRVNFVAHGGIKIGHDVTIGNDVQFLTVFHSLHPQQRLPIRTSPIVIKDGARIGDGSLVISSRKNGRAVVIGPDVQILPNSVVIGDIYYGVAGGRPARPLEPRTTLARVFHPSAPQEEFTALETIQAARQRFGATIEPGLPIHVAGRGSVTADGFYLINRGSTLSLKGDMHIGHDVLIGHSVSITVEEGASLDIGKNVWFGAGASVVAGHGQKSSIGEGSVIAAGAHITQTVAPNSVMTGENVLKKKITQSDFDDSLPSHWMDAARCIRNVDEIAHRKAEIVRFIKAPADMKRAVSEVMELFEEQAPRREIPLGLNARHPS